jgi:tripartite-type tricarboxylate transporter receptor subunit TctC
MRIPRRRFLHLAGGAAALPTVPRIARAQTYPTRPITMIMAFPAGGPADVVGRVMAERMRNSLGQAIIIENISGANGSIGVGRAARAKPDGYTITFGLTSTHVLNGALYALRYDVLNDFAPVSPLVAVPLILLARKATCASLRGELVGGHRLTFRGGRLSFLAARRPPPRTSA